MCLCCIFSSLFWSSLCKIFFIYFLSCPIVINVIVNKKQKKHQANELKLDKERNEIITLLKYERLSITINTNFIKTEFLVVVCNLKTYKFITHKIYHFFTSILSQTTHHYQTIASDDQHSYFDVAMKRK